MRWKAVPYPDSVYVSAGREEFPRKQGILQALEKNCQAKYGAGPDYPLL